MTELLAALPTKELKEDLLFIQTVDDGASKSIEITFDNYGLEWAIIHIAAWLEAQKEIQRRQQPAGGEGKG